MNVRMTRILKAWVLIPVLLAALAWGGSFTRKDILWLLCPDAGTVVLSSTGKLKVLVYIGTCPDGWSVQHRGLPAEVPNRSGPLFHFRVFHTALQAAFPYWLLVLLLGLPALLYLLFARGRLTNPNRPPDPTSPADAPTSSALNAVLLSRAPLAAQRNGI